MVRHLVLGGGGNPDQEREVWQVAFAGLRNVVYWPFAWSGDELKGAPERMHGALARLGIQAEVDTWLTLVGHTAAELESADLLFVGGGETSKLLGHIREHGFGDHVATFVEHGGRYYGTSAGALVATESIVIAALADNDPPAAAFPTAMGLFCGVTILPHADTFAPSDIQSWARELSQRILAIPEAGGVDIQGDAWTVLGPDAAMLVRDDCYAVLSPGTRIAIDTSSSP
jgi:dipeptidase E